MVGKSINLLSNSRTKYIRRGRLGERAAFNSTKYMYMHILFVFFYLLTFIYEVTKNIETVTFIPLFEIYSHFLLSSAVCMKEIAIIPVTGSFPQQTGL